MPFRYVFGNRAHFLTRFLRFGYMHKFCTVILCSVLMLDFSRGICYNGIAK